MTQGVDKGVHRTTSHHFQGLSCILLCIKKPTNFLLVYEQSYLQEVMFCLRYVVSDKDMDLVS